MWASQVLLFDLGQHATLASFVVYTVFVLLLAALAHRLSSSTGFLSEYFLGRRRLGVWAFAFTLAATGASGGSFMGFPSKIYTHGWVLALWISSYMLVPVFIMGLLGKRFNQLSRRTGAITIPAVLRDRLQSLWLGMLATLLIVFFISVNLIAQFKAGSKILQVLLDDLQIFHNASLRVAGLVESSGLPGSPEGPGYTLCLLAFALVVIFYTTYGGFRAVVWTDVLQGAVMVLGVIVLLLLTLQQVGGLAEATRKLSELEPPRWMWARIEVLEPPASRIVVPKGTWLELLSDPGERRILRSAEDVIIDPLREPQEHWLSALELVSSSEKASVKVEPLPFVYRLSVSRRGPNESGSSLSVLPAVDVSEYQYGPGIRSVYLRPPDPSYSDRAGFLPLSLAVSFFFMWTFSGAGQPSNMVRLMAFRGTRTLKRALGMVCIYYSLIYFPLVIIFTCSRVLLPEWDIDPDRIMPVTARALTTAAGHPWLAGLLVAAPFAAVMSTVDSFLLMISSALVRDVYQRNLNPETFGEDDSQVDVFGDAGDWTGSIGGRTVPASLSPGHHHLHGDRPLGLLPGAGGPQSLLAEDEFGWSHCRDAGRLRHSPGSVCRWFSLPRGIQAFSPLEPRSRAPGAGRLASCRAGCRPNCPTASF